MLPPPSLIVAVNTWVPPTTIPVVGAETLTVATGSTVTVIEDAPVFVSLVAVIVTGPPALTAVTKPFASTVATAVFADVQVMVRPFSTRPSASFVTAVSCCVGVTPTMRLVVAGVTVTVATGTGVTVIVALPVLVSLVATILAVPTAIPVTRP
jgi:hypothetical protein